jgi:hypothetical protein
MRVYYELLPIVVLVLFGGLHSLMGYPVRLQPAETAPA